MRTLMLALVLALLLLVAPTPAVAATSTWTEDWSNGTASWLDGAGQPVTTCPTAGGVLHATRSCAAQAFSTQRWDQTQPVAVSGTVRGQPVGSTPYFCGLALIEADNHNVYGQAAVGRDIQPVYPRNLIPQLIWWNDEYPNKASRYYYLGAVPVDQWQSFSVSWTPTKGGAGWWSATINSVAERRIKDRVTSPLTVDLQGAPLYDDGSTCEFGTVVVTGILE